jgi:hypothetical protein
MAEPGKKDRWLFASLQNYRPSWLVNDALAALTLAAIAIPEQLATGRCHPWRDCWRSRRVR